MREFRQQHGRAGERYWSIWFEGEPDQAPDIVASAWGGVKEGKRTEHGKTKDKIGPKGKAGTKAYMSGSDNAAFEMDRAIRKKIEEGYVEVGLDGRPLLGGAVVKVIDHGLPLPKHLCFSKPRNNMGAEAIQRLEEAGDLLFTRKMNGMMVIAHIDARGVVYLYSRRMETLTYHFPHLLRALGPTGMSLPPSSVLLFEAFSKDGNTRRDLLEVQSIMRSLPNRAKELQDERGYLKFYLFRIPIWKGVDLEKQNSCENQCYLIENTFTDRFIEWRDEDTKHVKGQFLYPIENYDGAIPDALAEAEAEGYEGWVCYQRSAIMGDYSYSFHGKPDRPACCFKMKAVQKDDFICYWSPIGGSKKHPEGSWGTGKNSSRVGTLSLYQLNPKSEEVYVCEVGSGLSDTQRDDLRTANFPLVAQVLFEDRFYISDGDKSNSLSLPRISQFREDKKPSECINDSL